jgi:hypothetical protein
MAIPLSLSWLPKDYHLLHFFLKVALALHGPHIFTVHLDPLITTEQFPEPEQDATQLVNVEPVFAVAVNVTVVPASYVAVPTLPFQTRGPRDAVTVPEPVPAFVTVST